MPVFHVILVIALMGLAVWAVTTLIPMPEKFRQAIYVVAVVALVGYLLQVAGVIGGTVVR